MHKALKHSYILEFLHSEIVDREREGEGYVPGLYILLELAVGGDLFDKIGELSVSPSCNDMKGQRLTAAPDVGIPEDLAKFYFAQMLSGIVSCSANRPQSSLRDRNLSIRRESHTET